ncbi:MAG: tyrosine--tRNA ligase [Candidatus Pacebacteria bacterium]|nr:tyrosine--tRNA ligase [Candidatus Paceibacterota bacterium]MDD5535281.1 tyrosine--tRNA ligase [Candidatus Paceibacterota bacterium]
MDILDDLKYRGLIYQISNLEGLRKEIKKGKIVLYCGFDPTADSLHIGNLLPILTLKRFQEAGHQPIALIGGGTGLIGDPSGKKEERILNPQETVKKWGLLFKKQIEKLLDLKRKNNPALIADNYNWLASIKAIDFLRDIGKHFTIPYMLAKDAVKMRLDSGISFTEFNYMVLQSLDFLRLFEKYNCQLQIGGSDQWGNITAGIDLIKKKTEKEVYGLTMPLVSKASGEKFGKTESGTIWLDAQKTSPYQFYQFWVNTDDQDVIQYLKYFTFLSREEVESLKVSLQKNPEKREAQKVLAKEVTCLVHGEEISLMAETTSQKLFYDNLQNFSEKELEMIFRNIPVTIIQKVKRIGLIDLLIKTRVCSSKRQAREDIKNKVVFINNKLYTDAETTIKQSDCFYGKYLLIKKGKRKYYFALWK